jgi:2-C-methyl-D-erythritol 4-phosphate cytidylyltransferase
MSTSSRGRDFDSRPSLEGSTWGIVYAAGSGTRFGGYKQFERIGDERLVDRCVASLTAVCDHVVVVLPPDTPWTGAPVAAAVTGGATNPDSVRAGMAEVPHDASVVVLHSPSHPLASKELVRRIVDHVTEGVDGACPIAPENDVLKRLDEHGAIIETLDKRNVVSVQMPLAFRAAVLRDALAADTLGGDSQTIIERHGARVVTVLGEPTNIHVTTREELEMARWLAPMVDRPR